MNENENMNEYENKGKPANDDTASDNRQNLEDTKEEKKENENLKGEKTENENVKEENHLPSKGELIEGSSREVKKLNKLNKKKKKKKKKKYSALI
eukprot:Trichotokara_eunicae@DN4011_c0_g1_i1.p1